MVMSLHKQLKVIEWNAIRSKICELYDYLINNEIDLSLINETKLNNNVRLRTNNHFVIVRLDREINVNTNRPNDNNNNPSIQKLLKLWESK